jgi:hypothetical protein
MPKAEARTVAAQHVLPVVDDEPLDAIQQSLMRLLIDLVVADVRAEIAAEIRAEEAAAAAHQVEHVIGADDLKPATTMTTAHPTTRRAE